VAGAGTTDHQLTAWSAGCREQLFAPLCRRTTTTTTNTFYDTITTSATKDPTELTEFTRRTTEGTHQHSKRHRSDGTRRGFPGPTTTTASTIGTTAGSTISATISNAPNIIVTNSIIIIIVIIISITLIITVSISAIISITTSTTSNNSTGRHGYGQNTITCEKEGTTQRGRAQEEIIS
jgi:hypothetical protein